VGDAEGGARCAATWGGETSPHAGPRASWPVPPGSGSPGHADPGPARSAVGDFSPGTSPGPGERAHAASPSGNSCGSGTGTNLSEASPVETRWKRVTNSPSPRPGTGPPHTLRGGRTRPGGKGNRPQCYCETATPRPARPTPGPSLPPPHQSG